MNAGLLDPSNARKAAARIKRRIRPRLAAKPARPPLPATCVDNGERLVPSPVFVFSAERSGSTLLRMILDNHSQICAPFEMHLRALKVESQNWFLDSALKKMGLGEQDLANLMWDRILHLQLTRSGKSVIVDKTPYNTHLWRRISGSWPEARYIFLRRHPLRIFESSVSSRPDTPVAKQYEKITGYARAWASARAALAGPTVTYEELTVEPERVVRELCEALGIAWEPQMLEYGQTQHGGFRRGLGDWTHKIKSGVIHEAAPLPDRVEIPDELVEACRLFGYL